MIVRIITALIGIPIILAVMYYGKLLLLFFVSLVILLGINEYHAIISKMNVEIIKWLSFALALLFPVATYFDVFSTEFLYTFIFLVYTIISLIFKKLTLHDSMLQLFGIIYIGGMFTYILKIRFLSEGFTYLLLTFIFIWTSDSAAYFVGRSFGRHKLAPSISPNKTIEGSIGGLLFTLIFAAIIAKYMDLPSLVLIVMGLLVNVLAQVGDLVESILKRQANIKDSGNTIPGHGGILDRFDSTFFAAPAVYYYLSYFLGR